MTDREKVIKGLEAHEKGCGYRSHHCDVMECPYRFGDESCDIEEMCHDALALLKQEAVEPVKKEMFEVTARYEFDCPCGSPLLIGQPYCAGCGKAVKQD